MKIKLPVLISIFVLSSSTAFAQTQNNSKQNSLEFSSGYTFGALKNLSFAPVVRYDYSTLNYQLKYVRTTHKNKLFEVQLGYLDSELQSEVIPVLDAAYSKMLLNFSYVRPVYTKNKLTIHVGLQSQTNVSGYNQWDAYDAQQKFGLAGRLMFKIDPKQSLSAKLTVPFFMWRVSTFEEELYSLGKYQSLMWNIEYKYRLSKHFDIKAGYYFSYDRLQISNAFRELQQQLNLGINLKF